MADKVQRIVIKVGTSTLTHPSGRTNIREMEHLVRVISDIMNRGIQAVLVTSGAIGVGVGKLRLKQRPGDTPGKQAAATVGQCELMFMYDKMFAEYGYNVGQLLITREDVEDPVRHHNLVNCLENLFQLGVLPIINENDAVAVEEIVYGDNDSLSAIVARLVHADELLILSDIDGLFDGDPRTNPDARRIPRVESITPELYRICGGAGSGLGTGGMETKVRAAEIATQAGIRTRIINGIPAENIYLALEGADIGTVFEGVH